MIYRLVGLVTLCNLIVCTPALSESRPRGDSHAGKALVYLIQPEGPRRHLFSGQEWLGVVDENAYTFTHVAPGEHFIWVNGGRVFEAVFFMAGSTNYVEIGAKTITILSPEKGESMLAQAATYSEPADGDRADSYRHLKQYRKAAREKNDRWSLLRLEQIDPEIKEKNYYRGGGRNIGHWPGADREAISAIAIRDGQPYPGARR